MGVNLVPVEDYSALLDDTGQCSFLGLSVSCHDKYHHINMLVPAIGASVGTPGEKYVLVCARASPARHNAARVPINERILARDKQQRYCA